MKDEGDGGWKLVLGWIEMKNLGWRREMMKDEGLRRWWVNDSIGKDRDEESRMKERKDEGDGGWMIVLGRMDGKGMQGVNDA